MKKISFKISKHNFCLYFGSNFYVFRFDDDALATGRAEKIETHMKPQKDQLCVKNRNEGIHWY